MTPTFRELLEHHRNPETSNMEGYRKALQAVAEEFQDNLTALNTVLGETLDDEAQTSLELAQKIAQDKLKALNAIREEFTLQKGSLETMRTQIQKLKENLAHVRNAAQENNASQSQNTETLFRIGQAATQYLAKHS